jgi:hypothetical protein
MIAMVPNPNIYGLLDCSTESRLLLPTRIALVDTEMTQKPGKEV